MPTCPNPEALQRLALSSHCRNLLKSPAFKTGTSRKIFATKQRVKHTFAAYLLSKKTKLLNMEHQKKYNFKFPEQTDVSRAAKRVFNPVSGWL